MFYVIKYAGKIPINYEFDPLSRPSLTVDKSLGWECQVAISQVLT